MKPATSTSQAQTKHRHILDWKGWIVAAAGAMMLGGYWHHYRARPPSSGPEMLRQELAFRDGRYWVRQTQLPFNGVVLENYPNGARRSRSVVSNGWLEGLSVGYYTNGLRQIEEHFREGVSSGSKTKWYEDGSKLSEAAVVDGKLEGTFRRWHANGVLAEEVTLQRGLAHGLSRAFYPSGRRKAEARMHQGQVLERQFWPDNDLSPADPVRKDAAATTTADRLPPRS